MQTIFAVSSGRPPAAIAVIRVSGPKAATVAVRLAGGVPEQRRATLRALRNANGALLDRALVLWFPGPNTATGEDLLELHVHGGRAVIAALEAVIGAMPNLRRAEPGEFTRRALLSGRIDLAQAAGLADLLEAETETQRRAAIASTEGALSRDLHRWLDRLSDARAMIEAMIDYEEEGDVSVSWHNVRSVLSNLVDELDAAVAKPTVEQLRHGFRVVIAGPPNAGKSSLFNILIRRDAAIVAAIPGTTRDRIEATVTRSGTIFTLMDTAGLATHSDDPVEIEGIGRSHAAMASADLVLWLGDESPNVAGRSLWLRSRCDEPGREVMLPGQVIAVSVARPDTIASLWKMIAAQVAGCVGADEDYLLRDLQRASVAEVAIHSREAMCRDDPILSAESLRIAARDLGRLLGIDETEAMLNALFERFCVGK